MMVVIFNVSSKVHKGNRKPWIRERYNQQNYTIKNSVSVCVYVHYFHCRSGVYKAMQTVDATRMTNRRKRVCRRRDYVSVVSSFTFICFQSIMVSLNIRLTDVHAPCIIMYNNYTFFQCSHIPRYLPLFILC